MEFLVPSIQIIARLLIYLTLCAHHDRRHVTLVLDTTIVSRGVACFGLKAIFEPAATTEVSRKRISVPNTCIGTIGSVALAPGGQLGVGGSVGQPAAIPSNQPANQRIIKRTNVLNITIVSPTSHQNIGTIHHASQTWRY